MTDRNSAAQRALPELIELAKKHCTSMPYNNLMVFDEPAIEAFVAALFATAPSAERDLGAEEWAELYRLREAVKGPDGYATWQDAATAERLRRVKAEAALAAAPKGKTDPVAHGLPPYPAGEVAGPCVCGSWPGGKCLRCEVIPAKADERGSAEPVAQLRHLYANMVNGAVRDTASAKRIATGLLGPVIEQLEAAPPAAQKAHPDSAQARDAALNEAAKVVEDMRVGFASYFEINERLQQAADAIRALKGKE